jgi:signal transduction histidine kinase
VPAARDQVVRLGQLSREALDELRSLILGLRPPELERDGLAVTLRKEVEMLRRLHDVEIELDLDGDGRIDGDPVRAAEVLRIVQEALHNALRHAEARRVVVRVREQREELIVEVTDDGIGFAPQDPALRSQRLGLTSMEERAHELGAQIEIRSAPGSGTTVRLVA